MSYCKLAIYGIFFTLLMILFNGCALHRGGNNCDYINDKVYFYGEYNNILGWGKLRFHNLEIGRYISSSDYDIKYAIKLKDGRVLKISNNEITENYIKKFAVKIKKNRTFIRPFARYVKSQFNSVVYKDLGIDYIYNDVTKYYVVDENNQHNNSHELIYFCFYKGRLIFSHICSCGSNKYSSFGIGCYYENQYFQLPLAQEQIEYIFGQPEFYRNYWF
ncbi:hypothetical protein AAEX28_05720 [Lentisphaerota bacterium WC36G]|nr:hypothetical protein LJT99_08580 [Lentisphaerae bacterium WC36]